jgi:hypothetical protein
MGFNFPGGPSVGQEFTSGGATYVWNGYGWATKSSDAPSDGKLYGRKNATLTPRSRSKWQRPAIR